MATVVILVSTSATAQTYSVPSDWANSSNTVEAIGNGGGGNDSGDGTGGGGGAYTKATNVSLTPGGTTSFTIKAGALVNNGGDDVIFVNSSTVLAKGGSTSAGATALGGQAGSCVPAGTAFSGGTSGDATNTASSGGGGAASPGGAGKAGGSGNGSTFTCGGGGGAGGISSTTGGAASTTVGGVGGSGPTGTAGGAGGTSVANGAAGSNGSGGGGGGVNTQGGDGGGGTEWSTAGAGGGGGGSFTLGGSGGNGGLYGGGGGGGDGHGAQGVIVLTYTPSGGAAALESFPASVRALPTRINFQGAFAFGEGIFNPEIILLDKWAPSYPSRVPALQRPLTVPQLGQYSYDFGVVISEVVTLDKWAPHYPDTTSRAKGAFYVGGTFAPTLSLTEIIQADKWLPRYPDRAPKYQRPLGAFQTGAFVYGFAISTAEAVTMDKWFQQHHYVPPRKPTIYTFGAYTNVSGAIIVPGVDKWFSQQQYVPPKKKLFHTSWMVQPLVSLANANYIAVTQGVDTVAISGSSAASSGQRRGKGYNLVPEVQGNEVEHRRKLAIGVNQALSGKINVCSNVTLTPNAASTTITDQRIAVTSFIHFMPQTANASAELGNGTIYVPQVTQLKGSAVVQHANNAQTDRTYTIVILG